ncbi:hypothetical protein M3Y97_00810200 [Aphelenchoides bicaudatus]|nr:hypothetical protein M3Y97_00810200 [Aphelenchoides bicaudatus]
MLDIDTRPVNMETDATIFVHIPDNPHSDQKPTTSQESSDSNFNELLSNYTDETTLNSPTHSLCSKVFETKCTAKFPAFKWEMNSLPDNIVDQHSGRSTNSINNGSISQQSPYSLNQWSSSNSSPLPIHRTNLQSLQSSKSSKSASLIENASSINEISSDLEPQDCLRLVELFHELTRDSQISLQTDSSSDFIFDYSSLDGTIFKLRTRDLTSINNSNPLFCRIKTQSVHFLMRVREQVVSELSKLLNESIEKENFGHWQRHEHKLSKRLSNSIRKARRLSSYGYKKDIFGRSLVSIRSHSNQGSPFPLFIHQALAILLYEAESHSTEGLMRTASSKSKLDVYYKLCNTLNVNDSLPAELCSALNVYILADLLKRFLREIPESLLPQHVWQLMVQCYKLESAERLLGLQYCVLLLNSSQREALFIVGAFLLELSRYKSNTLMDLNALVTVIMPNITEMEAIDPLEQGSKCKGLMATLTFLIENIYDVMCMPSKLMINSNEKFVYQIALNNIAFNVSYCHLQNTYWRNERVEMNDMLVKSRIDYNDLNSEPVEFRVETQINASGSSIFACLIDSNRYWDPTFNAYKRHGFVDEESDEIVECRLYITKNQSIYLKRCSGRIYDEKQAQVYVLIEKSFSRAEDRQVEFNQTFLIQPLDVYNSKVILLSSIVVEEKNESFGALNAARVLSAFKHYYQSTNNSDLNGERRP